jgi:ferric-dicitrate binding protein FerR (iron transport regulator)
MNNQPDERSWTTTAEEEAVVRLLRFAGPRPPVPALRAARVRAAVHAHWQVGRGRRASRRRLLSGSLLLATAAALILMVARVVFQDRAGAPAGELVAVVEQMEGEPRRAFGMANAVRLEPNESIRPGEWIETDAHARVALRFSDGASVRIDAGSRVRALAPNSLDLSAGAVYVDTGRESGGFEVRTPVATARDVGTQFEVRMLGPSVRLRVRTGLVELKDNHRSVTGRGGTEVLFSSSGAESRPIAAHGSEWDWTIGVAPPLNIEGLALSAVLERVARENGWTLRYADPSLAREASAIILHGSVKGLAPREALDVAIATSGLRHRLEHGELVVLRGSDAR